MSKNVKGWQMERAQEILNKEMHVHNAERWKVNLLSLCSYRKRYAVMLIDSEIHLQISHSIFSPYNLKQCIAATNNQVINHSFISIQP